MNSTNLSYKDFIIRITADSEEGKYIVSAEAPGDSRTTSATRTIPKAEPLKYIQGTVAELYDMEKLGAELFEFLFPEEVLRVYERACVRLDKNNEGLLIRLQWDRKHAQLNQLPWECCFDKMTDKFIDLSKKIVIVRDLNIATEIDPISTPYPEPMKFLVVAANPKNFPEVNFEKEIERIEENLKLLSNSQKVDIQVITQATRADFKHEVQKYEPHVLHLIGHGRFGEREGEFAFCPTDGKEADYLTATEIAVILSDLKRLPLIVILNGCETAASNKQNSKPIEGSMSLASILMNQGIMAVIGMQFTIKWNLAINFIDSLYEKIAKGWGLPQALSEARKHLFVGQQEKNGWATPALFMRNVDTRLFEPKDFISDTEQTSIEKFRKVFMDLNYKQQFEGFNQSLFFDKAGAFLISGEEDSGSEWLLHHLTSNFFESKTEPLTVDVTIDYEAAEDTDATWLWTHLGHPFELEGSLTEKIMDEICRELDDQNILIVVRDATKWERHYPEILLSGFWEPLITNALSKSSNTEHWLIFMMVDNKAVVSKDDAGNPFLRATILNKIIQNSDWTPKDPFLLGPLGQNFSSSDIINWVSKPEVEGRPAMKERLKKRKLFVMEHTDMSRIKAIRNLCKLCGIQWNEVEQKWLKL